MSPINYSDALLEWARYQGYTKFVVGETLSIPLPEDSPYRPPVCTVSIPREALRISPDGTCEIDVATVRRLWPTMRKMFTDADGVTRIVSMDLTP